MDSKTGMTSEENAGHPFFYLFTSCLDYVHFIWAKAISENFHQNRGGDGVHVPRRPRHGNTIQIGRIPITI